MKVGIVIVTHYRLGEEFLQALDLIVPEHPPFQAVSVDPKQAVDEMRDAIAKAIRGADAGEGVLVLTDMFGGTPSNLAISIMDSAAGRKETGGIEVIAGVNLPMLIKLASLRSEKSLADIVAEAQDAGRKYINVASTLLQKGD